MTNTNHIIRKASKDLGIQLEQYETSGEAQIKAQMVLNAWHNYCMQSRVFRILRFFGLRN